MQRQKDSYVKNQVSKVLLITSCFVMVSDIWAAASSQVGNALDLANKIYNTAPTLISSKQISLSGLTPAVQQWAGFEPSEVNTLTYTFSDNTSQTMSWNANNYMVIALSNSAVANQKYTNLIVVPQGKTISSIDVADAQMGEPSWTNFVSGLATAVTNLQASQVIVIATDQNKNINAYVISNISSLLGITSTTTSATTSTAAKSTTATSAPATPTSTLNIASIGSLTPQIVPAANIQTVNGALNPQGALHSWAFNISGDPGEVNWYCFLKDIWNKTSNPWSLGSYGGLGVATSIPSAVQTAMINAFNAGQVSMSLLAFDANGKYISTMVNGQYSDISIQTFALYIFDQQGNVIPGTPISFPSQNYIGNYTNNPLEKGDNKFLLLGFGISQETTSLTYPFIVTITNPNASTTSLASKVIASSAASISGFDVGGAMNAQLHLDLQIGNQTYVCANNYSINNPTNKTYPAAGAIPLTSLVNSLNALSYAQWVEGVYLSLVQGTNAVWVYAQDSNSKVLGSAQIPNMTTVSGNVQWGGSFASMQSVAYNKTVLYQVAGNVIPLSAGQSLQALNYFLEFYVGYTQMYSPVNLATQLTTINQVLAQGSDVALNLILDTTTTPGYYTMTVDGYNVSTKQSIFNMVIPAANLAVFYDGTNAYFGNYILGSIQTAGMVQYQRSAGTNGTPPADAATAMPTVQMSGNPDNVWILIQA